MTFEFGLQHYNLITSYEDADNKDIAKVTVDEAEFIPDSDGTDKGSCSKLDQMTKKLRD